MVQKRTFCAIIFSCVINMRFNNYIYNSLEGYTKWLIRQNGVILGINRSRFKQVLSAKVSDQCCGQLLS